MNKTLKLIQDVHTTKCMSAKKIQQFLARFEALLLEAKSLDFKLNKFAFDLRAEFAKGDVGEMQFKNWITLNIPSATATVANEFVLRAKTAALLSEEEQKAVGGFKAVKAVLPLTKTEQVRVIAKAKDENKTVYKAMQELGHAPEFKTVKPRASAWQDCKVLSEYVANIMSGKKIPKNIREIMDRYVVAVKLKSVA